jgi:hypothetical protein
MDVFDFISDYSGNQQKCMLLINNLISEIPGIQPKIRFKIPFYYRKTWICYLNPIKYHSVELCFVRAKELVHTKIYLQFGKRVQVGGIMLTTPEDIDIPLIRLILEEAVQLDETTPYTFKKKRKLPYDASS